jgi:aldose 1-epimerase
VRVLVTYTINDKDELEVEYEAVTSAPTVINLTQHTYWNLGGAGSGDILAHQLILNASRYTPVDRGLIPTGAIESVVGTPFDFRISRRIGDRIDEPNEQLQVGEGYDHNFILDPLTADQPAARLRDPVSGRILEIRTTEPGVQVYTGNQLDGSVVGKYGIPYDRYAGMCLETQHFPDSPNHAGFPSTVLRPGDRYVSRTVFAFRQEG